MVIDLGGNPILLPELQRGSTVKGWTLQCRAPRVFNSAIEEFIFVKDLGATVIPVPRSKDDQNAMDCITISLGLAEAELRRRAR